MRGARGLLSISVWLAAACAPAIAAAEEKKPPRPALPPEPPAVELPWERHIEVGGDAALVFRPASTDADGKPTDIRYRPAIGFGVHARWEIFRFLRFSTYFVDSHHDVAIPSGGLGEPGEVRTWQEGSETPVVETFSFGARLAPALPLGTRARSWLSVGIGYGRFEFGDMAILDPAGTYRVRERAMSFMEIPLGIGTSIDIIRNWLTIELEASWAFALGQEGESVQPAQAIDAAGERRTIGVLPKIDGSFVQTIGLSLVL